MKGTEHYMGAEESLRQAADAPFGTYTGQYHLAVAQVHATLALAAATALATPMDLTGNQERDAWREVAK